MTVQPRSHRSGTSVRSGAPILPMMTAFTLVIVLAISAVAAAPAVWTLVGGAALLVAAVAGGVAWLLPVLGDDA